MPPKDKKEKKEKPAGWNLDATETVIVLIFLIAVLSSLPMILNRLLSGDISFYGYSLSSFFYFFRDHVQFFKALGFVTAGVAAVGTFGFNKMADQIWVEMKSRIYPDNMPKVATETAAPKNQHTDRWQKIVALSESKNSSDWRLAIIEADIILDELLDSLHLPGDTMGERLKAVEKSDFTTIEFAWEAHKVRNTIAHEGSNFLLNDRETRRIISLYEAVFKEFFLI